MDYISVRRISNALKNIGINGAPGTIRTCDRLVRSQPHICYKSITCAIFFWPRVPSTLPNINNLAGFFGRAFCWSFDQ